MTSRQAALTGPFRSFWLILKILCLVGALAGCAGGAGTGRGTPSPTLVVTIDPVTGEEVVTTSTEAYSGTFWSHVNLRETYYSGNTRARLEDQTAGAPTGFIDTRAINAGPLAVPEGADIDLPLPGAADIRPLPPATIDGALWQPRYSERATVELNYTNEPLTQVIQNILGGILGQNFIIGESVTGTLTFRSETRFARSQLVQVLADIVAREGYQVRFFNSVYYIGTPDELDRLVVNRQGSVTGDASARTIPVTSGDVEQVASLVQSLAPPSVRVGIAPDGRSLLIQGDPAQFPSVETLVNTLVETGVAEQRVAIVNLRQNDPETVAEDVSQLYEQRGIGDVTIIPLTNRQAILVAANTRNAIQQTRTIIRSLDQDRGEQPSLRVVQLRHIPADDMASQINAVFGAGVDVAAASTEDGGRRSAVLDSAASLGSTSAAEATGITAPSTITGRNGATGQPPAAAIAAGGLSVVADTRNNALLVRSTYPEFVRIQKVVRSLDVPLAQVVIEATVLEVDINDELQLGVQVFLERNGISIRSSQSSGSSAGDIDGSGFTAVIQRTRGDTTASAVIAALQGVSNVKVISSPYVTVANGNTSRLSVGNQIPYTTTSQSSNSDGNVVVTQEIETRDVGVLLEVTPTIRPDNSVILDVNQTVSSASSTTTAAGSNPIISQKSVQSQVLVNSGFTVLLGGLIAERSETNEGGVPGLRKLPGLGGLFNSRTNIQNRTELLVLITPRVVRNTDSLSHLTEQLRWATSTN